jgi:hypothetical protein
MSIDAYLSARYEAEKALANVKEIVEAIYQISGVLRSDPEHFSFSNTGIGLPAHVLGSGHSVDSNRWPSARQVMEALAAWHDAKFKMEGAWQVVPPDRQSGLQPPLRYR